MMAGQDGIHGRCVVWDNDLHTMIEEQKLEQCKAMLESTFLVLSETFYVTLQEQSMRKMMAYHNHTDDSIKTCSYFNFESYHLDSMTPLFGVR